jgi:hypothetical protein
MASQPEADVVVRTSAALIIAVLAAGHVHAEPAASATADDRAILGDDPGWQIEDVELRSSYLSQRGHGYQAQGGAPGMPGSERMWIFEPSALITVRQSAAITHEITVPVDIITAASPDAVDATTAASRVNESVDLDVRTTIKQNDHDTLTTRVSAHYEEPLSSGTLGAGWRRSFADDNATFGITGSVTVDGFDGRNHIGDYLGKTSRETANANLSLAQLLSPTTTAEASYGITYQHGTLFDGWNSVQVDTGALADELLPRDRVRHALSLRLAQHLPATHSTLKAWYRAYLDNFGIAAHTIEVDAYQYLVPWLYVRGGYRYHHQTGADFFVTQLSAPYDPMALRTADSDLAPLSTNEVAIELAMVRGRTPAILRGWALGAEVVRYVRSNDLQITVVSLTVAKQL